MLPIFFALKTIVCIINCRRVFLRNQMKICSQNMKVLGYFGTVFLVYASQLLATRLCQADAKLEDSHIKTAQRNPTFKKHGTKYDLEKDLWNSKGEKTVQR